MEKRAALKRAIEAEADTLRRILRGYVVRLGAALPGEMAAAAAEETLNEVVLLASVRLWDAATGALLPPEQGYDASEWDNLIGTTYSPDGRLVAAIADQFDFETHVLVWDAETRERLLDLRTPSGAAAIDFSADGTRLVVGMVNGVVAVYGVE